MNRIMLILQEMIVVLQKNKMKITYKSELRGKLSDMAENVPKSEKSNRTD